MANANVTFFDLADEPHRGEMKALQQRKKVHQRRRAFSAASMRLSYSRFSLFLEIKLASSTPAVFLNRRWHTADKRKKQRLGMCHSLHASAHFSYLDLLP